MSPHLYSSHSRYCSIIRDTKLWMFQPQAKAEEIAATKNDTDEVDGEVVVPTTTIESQTLNAPPSESKPKPSPERIGSSNSEGKFDITSNQHHLLHLMILQCVCFICPFNTSLRLTCAHFIFSFSVYRVTLRCSFLVY